MSRCNCLSSKYEHELQTCISCVSVARSVLHSSGGRGTARLSSHSHGSNQSRSEGKTSRTHSTRFCISPAHIPHFTSLISRNTGTLPGCGLQRCCSQAQSPSTQPRVEQNGEFRSSSWFSAVICEERLGFSNHNNSHNNNYLVFG